MIKETHDVLTGVQDNEKQGWEPYKSLELYQGFSKGNVTPLRQLGHLRLLEGAVHGTDAKARHTLPTEDREATSKDISGRSMPKAQQKQNRSYRDDDQKAEYGPGAEASGEIPTIKREFILTPSADETLQDVVRLFSRSTGTNLTNSHFFRVLMRTLAHAMPKLEEKASQIGELKRPGNARGKEAEREEYEQAIAEAVVSALRSCPPFDSGKKRSSKGK